MPDSPGKANILARAAQATDMRWTPVRDVPTYTKATGKTVLPAGVEVVLSVFAEGAQQVSLSRDGAVCQALTITGKQTLQLEPGCYTATHSATGDTVSFRVIRPDIQYWVKDGMLTVHAGSSDPDSRVLCMDLREGSQAEVTVPDPLPEGYVWRSPKCASMAHLYELTEEERSSGVFTRPIHPDARNLKVVYENSYGIWTHTMLPLFKKIEWL